MAHRHGRLGAPLEPDVSGRGGHICTVGLGVAATIQKPLDLPRPPLKFDVAGPGGHICTVGLEVAATLQDLKAAVEESVGIPIASQRLFHGTRELLGSAALGKLFPCGAHREDLVQLLLVRRSQDQCVWLLELEAAAEERRVASWLRAAPAETKQDREVVLAAVAKEGMALKHAAPALRADPDVVLAAIVGEEWPFELPFEFASAELKADYNFVLAAVARCGRNLKFLSAEFRADRKVVMAAIGQSGLALEFASAELKAEREVVLAAIAKGGRALVFASAEIKADRNVVLHAVATMSKLDPPDVKAAMSLILDDVARKPEPSATQLEPSGPTAMSCQHRSLSVSL